MLDPVLVVTRGMVIYRMCAATFCARRSRVNRRACNFNHITKLQRFNAGRIENFRLILESDVVNFFSERINLSHAFFKRRHGAKYAAMLLHRITNVVTHHLSTLTRRTRLKLVDAIQ